jgi:hypothetical protein
MLTLIGNVIWKSLATLWVVGIVHKHTAGRKARREMPVLPRSLWDMSTPHLHGVEFQLHRQIKLTKALERSERHAIDAWRRQGFTVKPARLCK